MARKPKNANIDIRQTARVFDEQAFVDGVFNDDYILVVGSGVILDRIQFPDSKGDINQYIIDEINNERREVQTDFKDHNSFTDVYTSFGSAKEMTDFSHTLACCLSKLRSSLEAGMKQLRVWLQYRWSMVEGLHYSDLCLFIKAQCIHSTYMEIIRRVLEWVRCWGMYVNSRMMIVSWLHRYSFAFRRDTSRKWP